MNKVIISGRLTKDPEIRINGELKIARYTLAVDRIGKKKEGQPTADFINCVAFGKSADFAEKYMKKGRKFIAIGNIQTGSYTNKDGQKVYTTDVIVESQEFADAKSESGTAPAAAAPTSAPQSAPASEDFMSIAEGCDTELPFS